jgi:hypothetical protein
MTRKWILWLLAILILLPSAYLLYTYQSIKSTAVRIYEEREPSPVVPTFVHDRTTIQVGEKNMKDADPCTHF